MKIEKITVIGGSGFIGTNLCRKLELKGKNFEILDLKLSKEFPQHCKITDVRDLNSLKKAITGDVVINLAAAHRDDLRNKSEYYETNVIGAENVATVCSLKGIHKIIFTSTVAVYGFAEPGANESSKISPYNEYGRTKYEAEEKFRLWQLKEKNSLIIVRPTVIFGEGNRGNVFNLFNQIALGKFIMIGKGNNKKSIAYIGNVVAFLEACIYTNQKYEVYNYTDTPDLTMNELVSRVRKALRGKQGVGIRLPFWMGILLGYCADGFSKLSGKNLPFSSLRVKKFAATTEFKTTKIPLGGFIPPFKLLTGIEKTLQFEFISPVTDSEVFYTE